MSLINLAAMVMALIGGLAVIVFSGSIGFGVALGLVTYFLASMSFLLEEIHVCVRHFCEVYDKVHEAEARLVNAKED